MEQEKKKTTAIIAITYLFYIIFYESLVLGGTAYIVFWLHYSPWWWVLGICASMGTFTPSQWHGLLTGIDPKKEQD